MVNAMQYKTIRLIASLTDSFSAYKINWKKVQFWAIIVAITVFISAAEIWLINLVT